MAIGKLYISHKDYNFGEIDGQLLTSDNIKDAIGSWKVQDYCTSVEDCGLLVEEIRDGLLKHAKEIIPIDLVGNTQYNTEAYTNLAYQIIQHYPERCSDVDQLKDLLVYGQFNYHYNFEKLIPDTNKEKLWIMGCSFSSRVRPEFIDLYGRVPENIQYVEDHERWGYIVAQELNSEELNMAFAGSSVYDGLRRIIESDAKKGDKLIWQITSEVRQTVPYPDGMISSILSGGGDAIYKYKPLTDYINTLDQTLSNLMHIRLGMEYCRKQGIDLYIVNMLGDHEWLKRFCQDCKYLNLYRHMPDYIDYGSDGSHPGPKQNAEYAKEIIKFIEGKTI